jgi:PKD repeat protein
VTTDWSLPCNHAFAACPWSQYIIEVVTGNPKYFFKRAYLSFLAFLLLEACGSEDVYSARQSCWNGIILTSGVSQLAADALLPTACEGFNAAQAQAVKFTVAVDIGPLLSVPIVRLEGVPSGAIISPSTVVVRDSKGKTYSLGISDHPPRVSASPQLPFNEKFEVTGGALTFTNAPAINLSSKTIQTPVFPIGPTSVIVPAVAPYFAGTSTKFSGSTSTVSFGSIVSYDWIFGDGSVGSGASVSHTYSGKGSYSVTLTIADSFGRKSSNTALIDVAAPNLPPVARISVLPSGPPPLGAPIAGVDTVFRQTGSSDFDGEIVSYSWDFGDGTTRLISANDTGNGIDSPGFVRHVFAVAGTYLVKLTVTDNLGLTNTASEFVMVVNP